MRKPCPIACLILAISALALSGCATGVGTKWYAPATWFSKAPALKADRAEAKVEAYREEAVKQAQRLAHETQEALSAAPASRPVEVAIASNDGAVALLDQANGSVPAAELTALRATVKGLLSDNAEVRFKAEQDKQASLADTAKISTKLAQAVEEAGRANDGLRKAYDRENALANQLRAQRALVWIAGGVAVLAAAGWFYVRFFLGGVPGAVGTALASIQRKSPSLADELRGHLDINLNRNEQAAIAAAFQKAL